MVTKVDLIEYAAERTGVSRKETTAVVEAVLEYTADTLAEGGEVRLHGFGSFTTTKRPARKGRNPRTGVEVKIPATVVAKFKPALALREAVSQA